MEKHTPLADFLRGLVASSMTSVVIALAVPCAFFLTAILAGDRVIRSDAYSYIMRDPFDTHTLVSHRVLRESATDQPRATILGDSIMLFCIDETLNPAADLPRANGSPSPMLILPTPAQSTYEMATIIEELDLKPGSLVIVGLSIGVLMKPTAAEEDSILASVIAHPRLAFQSPVLADEARLAGINPPPQTGIYMLDNGDYFLSRKTAIALHLLKGGPEYGNPLGAHWVSSVDNDAFHTKEKASVDRLAEAYARNSAENYNVLQRMIARETARLGTSFIVLQAPINPGWYDLEQGANLFDRFQNDARAFAEQMDAFYFSIPEARDWSTDEFIDFEGHLKTPSARMACTHIVGEAVAAWSEEVTQ